MVKRKMTGLLAAVAALAAQTGSASAQSQGGGWWGWWQDWFGGGHSGGGSGGGGYSNVPEIDAGAGFLAVAAVLAAAVLVWELRRRRPPSRQD